MPAFKFFFAVRRFLVAFGISAFRLMIACRISCSVTSCVVSYLSTFYLGLAGYLSQKSWVNLAIRERCPIHIGAFLGGKSYARCPPRMKSIPMWFKY